MAIPGFGARLVNDLLMEVSRHLVSPILLTNITQPVPAAGIQTITVASLFDAANGQLAVYVGAMLVCDTGTNAEVITLTDFDPVAGTITAVFANLHASGAALTGATFPTQQVTDPIFTQSEMIGYVARAQNEFLEKVPVAMQLSYQQTATNQLYQPLPSNAIELNHVSLSQLSLPIVSLVRSGSVVTATFTDPHGLAINQTFWVVNPSGSSNPLGDASFYGVFQVASVPTSRTLTYLQYEADASTTGGTAAYFNRLYEVTQTELTMANRQWRNTPGTPTSFFEDRSGNYQWGLGPIPAVGFPIEVLYSIRDSDTLTLLDGFLVADQILYVPKYLALSYIFSKDGVYHDSQRAKFCMERFKRGVMALNRWCDANVVQMQAASA